MRKILKTVALLMALAVLAGVALTEGVLEAPDTGLDIEETEDLEIGEGPDTDVVDDMSGDVELSLGELDLQAHVTYRFFVDDVEVATQAAGTGEEIRRPEAPEAPNGKAFAGWALVDGTPLFVDADGDGKPEPVIVQDYELGTEVCVWAVFTEESQTEEQPVEEQPVEEQPAGEEEPTEEQHVEEEQPTEEQPTESSQELSPATEGSGSGRSDLRDGGSETAPEEVVPQTEPTTGEKAEEEPTSSVSPDGEPASPKGEASDMPTEEAQPTEEQPTEEAQPIEEQPTEEQPTEEAQPIEEQPAEEEPIEEQPIEETQPIEEQPAEEEPIEEQPTEEAQPIEEQPVEEDPIEEQPTEEAQLIEEQSVEEEFTEGKSTAATPVANALVYTGEAQALVSGEGWLYSLDGETYSADIPTAVDAGEYTVYYKTAEDAEAQTMTVTVAKADVVLVPPEAMTAEE